MGSAGPREVAVKRGGKGKRYLLVHVELAEDLGGVEEVLVVDDPDRVGHVSADGRTADGNRQRGEKGTRHTF